MSLIELGCSVRGLGPPIYVEMQAAAVAHLNR